MQTGKKAQGFDCPISKMVVIRHGHAPRRSPNSAEKALETRVRQLGKKACRNWDE